MKLDVLSVLVEVIVFGGGEDGGDDALRKISLSTFVGGNVCSLREVEHGLR